MKRIIPFLFLICFMLTSINVKAYDPENSGFKYYELQKRVYVNSDKITEIPTEVQEAWDEIGSYYMKMFEREKTTLYYTTGVSLSQRYTDDGVNYDGLYIKAQTVYTVKIRRKYYHPERGGKIYVYSDVKSADTVIHEYGHAAYDIYRYRIGFFNDFDDTWEEIYDKNKDILAKYDKISSVSVPLDSEEGFAEAFRWFVKDPESLNKKSRRVYTYMLEVMQKAGKFRE